MGNQSSMATWCEDNCPCEKFTRCRRRTPNADPTEIVVVPRANPTISRNTAAVTIQKFARGCMTRKVQTEKLIVQSMLRNETQSFVFNCNPFFFFLEPYCALSNNFLKYPVRNKDCRQTSCYFEMKEITKWLLEDGRWRKGRSVSCPSCKLPICPRSFRLDTDYSAALANIQELGYDFSSIRIKCEKSQGRVVSIRPFFREQLKVQIIDRLNERKQKYQELMDYYNEDPDTLQEVMLINGIERKLELAEARVMQIQTGELIPKKEIENIIEHDLKLPSSPSDILNIEARNKNFENIIKILEEQAAKTSGLTKRDETKEWIQNPQELHKNTIELLERVKKEQQNPWIPAISFNQATTQLQYYTLDTRIPEQEIWIDFVSVTSSMKKKKQEFFVEVADLTNTANLIKMQIGDANHFKIRAESITEDYLQNAKIVVKLVRKGGKLGLKKDMIKGKKIILLAPLLENRVYRGAMEFPGTESNYTLQYNLSMRRSLRPQTTQEIPTVVVEKHFEAIAL